LHLHNNCEIAAQKSYKTSGETNAFVDTLTECLAEMGYSVEWNNKIRKYEFTQHRSTKAVAMMLR